MRGMIFVAVTVLWAGFSHAAPSRIQKLTFGPGEFATKRFFSRPVTPADLPDIRRIHGDPLVWKAENYRLNDENFPLWPSLFRFDPSSTRIHRIKNAVIAPSDSIIGFAAIAPTDEPGMAEINATLAPEFWRNGVMSELMPAFVDYYAKRFKLKRLVAETFEDNAGAKRLLEKLGFQYASKAPLDDYHVIRKNLLLERWTRDLP